MKINITHEVSDELEILPCPCCSSDDVYANSFQGGIYQDGKCSAWVGCNSCKHTVNIESYSDSKKSLLKTAIARWNSQNKLYGKETKNDEEIKKRDDLIKQLSDALSSYIDKPFGCSGKFCGLCPTYGACSIVKNRTLVDKAREILR